MQRWTLSLLIAGLALCLLAGCSRKRANTAADVPVETTLAADAPAAPEAEPDRTAAAAPDDPLAGDLAAANEYARSRGLLGDVHFDYDRSDLTAEGRGRLAENARFLDRYPQFEALVEGHCDERGTPEYNLALGERRAGMAKSYLVSLGVDGSRLRTQTWGEERPVCEESDEGCWRQNRRAHFVLTGRLALP